MGSTGTGSFGNYSKSEKDVCPEEVYFVIEDFDVSEYKTEQGIPEVGQKVFIFSELVEKRLVVVEEETELMLGNVPTEHNYLFHSCIEKGKQYKGEIINVDENLITQIMVKLNVE
ncbi:hypothetical protein [Peloplasma aerotolerans]|uniref:YopX protein domain-containing protein n=1 Tax=Peloplasma aerotolerans TaxID=3044389 RepID=A0AAW6U4N1_9MOLU|nr:hypothetical protein [Mariniplasma sp. M4Ah]MDI6452842.1 hypothetical protein [Mariniplasma sp. M4Ah]